MAKAKYKFNPESLSYSRIEITFRQKVLKVIGYSMVFIVISIIGVLFYTFLFDSPEVKGLKRQNSELLVSVELFNKQLDKITMTLQDMQRRDDNLYRTIFEAEPLNSSVREAGVGGADRYDELQKMADPKLVTQTAKRLDKITRKIVIQSKSYDELTRMAMSKEKMLASIPAIQPISNKDLTRTASGWGFRIHPIYKIRKFHYGIDFTAPTGIEVYATGDGTIERIESSQRGYGNCIIVDHGYGMKTLYGHLSGFTVKQGQKVNRGDVIAFVGNTGLSTSPHLHYEVLRNGEKVNPINYFFNDLTAEEYDKMIEISMSMGQTFD
ncbi:MAG: peptidase [Bacteroidetes bacterium]|nr:peptidase [Bacteroidota bacterium]MBS1233689.1 peptidase [Bacteroidota bacterium]